MIARRNSNHSYFILNTTSYIVSISIEPITFASLTELICDVAFTLSESIFPLALENFSIFHVFSEPVLHIIFILAIIDRPIFEFENTLSFHFAVIEPACIGSSWQFQHALSMELISLEIPFVDRPISSKFVISHSMLGSVDKFSSVSCSISPFLSSLSIGQIICPFPIIPIFFLIADIDTSAFSHIMPNLAFIIGFVFGDEAALAMDEPIWESSIEVWSIFKEKLSNAMRLSIHPLALVDYSWPLNSMGRILFSPL